MNQYIAIKLPNRENWFFFQHMNVFLPILSPATIVFYYQIIIFWLRLLHSYINAPNPAFMYSKSPQGYYL